MKLYKNGDIKLTTLYFKINMKGEIEEISDWLTDEEEQIPVEKEEYRKMLEQCVNDSIELDKRISKHYDLMNYYGKNGRFEEWERINKSLVHRLCANFDFYWTLVIKYKGIEGARKIKEDNNLIFVSHEYIDQLLKAV